MSEHHPPPAVDPSTVRATGRRRARAITAGIAAAAAVGTGTVAVVAAVQGPDGSASTASASSASSAASPSAAGDEPPWTPSGATVTPGSGGTGLATSGGS